MLIDVKHLAQRNETRGETILDTVTINSTTAEKTSAQVSRVQKMATRTNAIVRMVERTTKQSSIEIGKETQEILQVLDDLKTITSALEKIEKMLPTPPTSKAPTLRMHYFSSLKKS